MDPMECACLGPKEPDIAVSKEGEGSSKDCKDSSTIAEALSELVEGSSAVTEGSSEEVKGSSAVSEGSSELAVQLLNSTRHKGLASEFRCLRGYTRPSPHKDHHTMCLHDCVHM